MLNTPKLRQDRRDGLFGGSKGSWWPFVTLILVWVICFAIVSTWGSCGQMKPIVVTSGTASWYGENNDHTDPWPHTITASGERFNENALTAASWNFPYGTRVIVRNINNGKKVIVRINDRGPGRIARSKGRIIDLSKAAFAKIADLKMGVIPVIVEKL